MNDMTPNRAATFFALLSWLASCGGGPPGHAPAGDDPKGPHGGRLLRDGSFAAEMTVYEPGLPPRSRVYLYDGDAPVDPAEVTLTAEFRRLDRTDVFTYRKVDDYLLGDSVLEEPHSFDVAVTAAYRGRVSRWTYPSYEGRTVMSPETARGSGVEVGRAGPAEVCDRLAFSGVVIADRTKVSVVTARFPGVVREVRRHLGDAVRRGDPIAFVEGNESLRGYDVTAPQDGNVLSEDVAVGESVGPGAPVASIGDLSSLLVEFRVPARDAGGVTVGKKIRLSGPGGADLPAGGVAYVAPTADRHTQSVAARARIGAAAGPLRPGLYVTGEVETGCRRVPVAVRTEAVQSFREWDVVFRRVGDVFETAPVSLGAEDGGVVEVTRGLAEGAEYATTNSFVVKADVMKAGAVHDH